MRPCYSEILCLKSKEMQDKLPSRAPVTAKIKGCERIDL